VVIFNLYSSKLHNFKYQPVVSSGTDWRNAARHASAFPGAPAEARAENIELHRRVMSSIDAGGDAASPS